MTTTRHTNTLLATLAALVMFLVLQFALVTPAYADYGGGSGTESDPYQINTAAHLAELRDNVNRDEGSYGSVDTHYVLTDNIDLSGYVSWTPIGCLDYYNSAATRGFRGTFDGNGYTISGLTIDLATATDTTKVKNAIGLFGATAPGSVLQNVNIANAQITGMSDDTNEDLSVGCLVGSALQTNIYNCNVMNSEIQDSQKSREFQPLYTLGGLAGDMLSTKAGVAPVIWNCNVECSITAASETTNDALSESPGDYQTYAGGIVGRSRAQANNTQTTPNSIPGKVENCVFTGTVAANGYVAPILGATRYTLPGKGGEFATKSDLSLAAGMGTNSTGKGNPSCPQITRCYFSATLTQSDGSAPKTTFNATEGSSTSYAYDSKGAYVLLSELDVSDQDFCIRDWGNVGADKAVEILNASKDSDDVLWRVAKQGNRFLPVLDMRSVTIQEVSRVDGEVNLQAAIAGTYSGEKYSVSGEWSAVDAGGTTVGVTPSGDNTTASIPLQSSVTTVTLEYEYDNKTKSTSVEVPAIGTVAFKFVRTADENGNTTAMEAVLKSDADGSVNADAFTYTWYEGDKVGEASIGEGVVLPVSGYKPGTKFTVRATLKTNENIYYDTTGVNQSTAIYVDEAKGNDGNSGKLPAEALQTLAAAYAKLGSSDAIEKVDQNQIVIIGEYKNDTAYGVEPASGVSPTVFNKPATISGGDEFTEEDEAYAAGVLYWYNAGDASTVRGKFLYADTTIQNITLNGGGGTGYVYCQGHNLTMGENVTMYNYKPADVKKYGLLSGTNVSDFTIVGGYLDYNELSGSKIPANDSKTCNIVVKSGCYARILAGCRNTGVNTDSHNVFGSEDSYFKASITVDIANSIRDTYNYDVGMLVGGQTDGTLYAANTVSLEQGDVGLLVGGSVGYDRNVGGGYPNNDLVGTIDVNVHGGSVEQLYGGCLGRHTGNTKNSSPVIDSYFRSSDTIRLSENRGDKPDITINISGGTISDTVYACGAGGTTGTEESPVKVDLSITGDATIKGSVYGGGNGATTTGSADNAATTAGSLWGTTSVVIDGATIEGSVFGGGAGTDAYASKPEKRALAQVYGDTSVIVKSGTIQGHVYGAGDGVEGIDALDMARVTGNTQVWVAGGTVGGNVYGGGNLGVVGVGTTTGNGLYPYTIERAGSTTVSVAGGSIGGSVFGGGQGFGQGTSDQSLIKGAVFGTSYVNIYQGTIAQDVFGGGNESRTYAPVEGSVAQQATTVVINSSTEQIHVLNESHSEYPGKPLGSEDSRFNDDNLMTVADNLANAPEGVDERTVTLGGSVFGGGNRSEQASIEANEYTVYGETDVYIKGVGVSFDGESGGVYGDGNISKVYGTRHIAMIDFYNIEGQDQPGYDPHKSFYSLQRADRVIMSNTQVYTKGALDRVTRADTTKYSINRVKLLELFEGSTLQLDTVVNGLGSLVSDVETSRSFRGNNISDDELVDYRTAVEGGTPWTSAPETLGGTGTTYDHLNAVVLNNGKSLDIAYNDDEMPGTEKYGQVKGLFTLSLLSANYDEGGAFVFGAVGDAPGKDQSLDSTGHFCCITKDKQDGSYLNLKTEQAENYRIWYVKGHTYQYDLSLKGYTTGNTTVSVQAWLPVDYVDSGDNYVQFDSDAPIAISDSIEKLLSNITPGDKKMQLKMAIAGTESSQDYYFQKGMTPVEHAAYGKTDLVPVSFDLALGSNLDELNDGQISFQLKDANNDNTYKFTLHITIEKPISTGYAMKHYGKIYGDVNSNTSTTITSTSAYTTEFVSTYSPAAYSNKSWSIIPYWDSSLSESGYQGHGNEGDCFEAGTKITMIDITNASSPQYYYYVCNDNESEINLDTFRNMASGLDNLFSKTKTGNTIIREKLLFIVDYENAPTFWGRDNQYLMLKHSYNNGAADILRFEENVTNETSIQHYVPGAVQVVKPGESAVNKSSISFSSDSSQAANTLPNFMYDSYNFTYSFALNDGIIDTNMNTNNFSASFEIKSEKELPLGSRIIVTDASGNEIPTRYYLDDKTVRIAADIGQPGTYSVKVQFSRYLTYGWHTQWYLQLCADLHSSPDGLYGNNDSKLGDTQWAQIGNLKPYIPAIKYNLSPPAWSLNSLGTVSAELTAKKEIPKDAKDAVDLAPDNGLVVMRSVKGGSDVLDVSEHVTPSQGNTSGTTIFKFSESGLVSGTTYVYTFRYGTTFETQEVTVK